MKAALRIIVGLALAATVLVPADVGGARVEVRETGAYAGYTLLVSQTTNETHLLDLEGRPVHTWRSGYLPGNSAHLRGDGLLLRAGRAAPVPPNFAAAPGGQGGVIELLDWDSRVVASFDYASDRVLQHHDAVTLPNGNVMFLAWEYKTADEAIAMGRDPALLSDGHLLPDSIVEVDVERGRVVWQWRVWDHLVQSFDAAKPNFGDPADQPGRIDPAYLVFNNGAEGARERSTVDEIVPVRKGRGFAMKDGVYRARVEQVYPHATAATSPLFAEYVSGAQRLPNGNTLVTDGPVGRVFEMTRGGTMVWEYRNDHFTPGPTITFQGLQIRPERLFKVQRYAPGHKAFEGRNLPPASPRRGEYSY